MPPMWQIVIKQTWDFVKHAGGEAVGKAISQEAPTVAKKVLIEPITKDLRAEVIEGMRRMANDDRRIIERRRRRAVRKRAPFGISENEFYSLLGKIPRIKPHGTTPPESLGGRVPTLTFLAQLPEELFWEYMYGYRHDPVQQSLADIADGLEQKISQTATAVGEKAALSAAAIDAGAAQATPYLEQFDNWLQGRSWTR